VIDMVGVGSAVEITVKRALICPPKAYLPPTIARIAHYLAIISRRDKISRITDHISPARALAGSLIYPRSRSIAFAQFSRSRSGGSLASHVLGLLSSFLRALAYSRGVFPSILSRS